MKQILFFLFLFSFPSAHAIPKAGQTIMISAATEEAVEAGKEIYKKGGNIVDAAVGVALSLAVTSPYNAAFGGGGFALVYFDKKPYVLDFREVAPLKAHPKYYLDKKKNASRDGGAAVGVPGQAKGLWELHQKFGKLKWQDLFDRALNLSSKGFQVNRELSDRIEKRKPSFNKGAKEVFLKKKKAYLAGQTLKQERLYEFLKKYQKEGANAFYEGEVAKDIIDTVNKNGGDFQIKDFENYKVRWLKPLTANYEGQKIYLMPPPSSGGVVIQTALKLIEKLELKKYKALSVDEFHLLAEILKHSFRGRALLGDPDFNDNPMEALTSKGYIKKLASNISLKKASKLEPLPMKWPKSIETTHFSLLDHKGNAFSATVTLNGNFGSGLVSNKFGIALNNEMDDFTTRPGEPNMYGLIQGPANQVESGKRPLSSMSPTIAVKNKKATMALGAPGGPLIISAVLQIIYRHLTSGYNIDLAIQTRRLHHQFLPDVVFVDKDRFSPDVLDKLHERGHNIMDGYAARGYGVIRKENGQLEAAFDSRGLGASGGY